MSNIKTCFTSRFKDGKIIEFDWNQLEIVILQVESQDSTLLEEINVGLDLHTVMTAVVHGHSYSLVSAAIHAGDKEWIARRKQIKSARFAVQYGAGAKKVAATANWSEEEAKKFIDAYYKRYYGIKNWNTNVKREVEGSAKPTGKVVDGVIEYKGQYISPNGRRYVFTGNANKWGGISFSPTKLQNYPIQGLASDFVKLMRSEVVRTLENKYTYKPQSLLVNSVHDSIVFDVHPDEITFVKDIVNDVYKNAQTYLSDLTMGKREVKVSIKYSVKENHYWS